MQELLAPPKPLMGVLDTPTRNMAKSRRRRSRSRSSTPRSDRRRRSRSRDRERERRRRYSSTDSDSSSDYDRRSRRSDGRRSELTFYSLLLITQNRSHQYTSGQVGIRWLHLTLIIIGYKKGGADYNCNSIKNCTMKINYQKTLQNHVFMYFFAELKSLPTFFNIGIAVTVISWWQWKNVRWLSWAWLIVLHKYVVFIIPREMKEHSDLSILFSLSSIVRRGPNDKLNSDAVRSIATKSDEVTLYIATGLLLWPWSGCNI